ncbi:MAG TPA: hypothetical protein VG899_12450 [Mycobacteriales bacterium]|nr:hypothetical protein [Mycobacteriales bacterium]
MTLLPCQIVELRIYDRDGTTLRGTFRGADDTGVTGLQWSDLLGTVGSSSLAVPLVQTIMASSPTLLDNAIAKIATNLGTDPDDLTEIFGFLCEGGQFSLVGDEEDAGKQRGLQCRGLLGLFDDAIIYPEGGFRDVAADSRYFGWMSAENAHWFDEDQWDGTILGTVWKDVTSDADRYRLPKGWPDPYAKWICVEGRKPKQYFRAKITVDEATPVRMYASADENLRVFLDSEQIIKHNAREMGYTELNHWRGTLSAGTHTIGIHFLRVDDSFWTFNEGWDTDFTDRGIFTCFAIDEKGNYHSLLRHSNDTPNWLGVGIGWDSRPPTWRAAGIVGILVDEAIARGVQSMSRISFGFDDTDDTAGNAWPDLTEKSWPVGTKYTQVLTDLGDDVDWDLLPDLTLNAYKSQGSEKSGTVALQTGVNILELTDTVTPPSATTMLALSAERWVEVGDKASESVNDRREGFLQTGGSTSRQEARHRALVALEGTATEQHDYSCQFVAVTGCVPYQDFGKGDWITCPDKTDTPVSMRVLSISGETPDDGPIRWTVELRPNGLPLTITGGGGGDGDTGPPVPIGGMVSEGDLMVAAGWTGGDDPTSSLGLEFQKADGTWETVASWSSATAGTSSAGNDQVVKLWTYVIPSGGSTAVRLIGTAGASAVIQRAQTDTALNAGHAVSAAWAEVLGGGTISVGAADFYLAAAWDLGTDDSDVSLGPPAMFLVGCDDSETASYGATHYVSGLLVGLNT